MLDSLIAACVVLLMTPQVSLSLAESAAAGPLAAVDQALNLPAVPDGVILLTRVTSPQIIEEVKPQYTVEAMKARIQGVVGVEAVVLPDGSVGMVRVVKSLDKEHGLDEQAIKAVKQWRFRPGKRGGVAVPVLVSIELTFALRDKRDK